MKTLNQHISQVKTLHSLNEFIEEKLIINKDYGYVASESEELKNIKKLISKGSLMRYNDDCAIMGYLKFLKYGSYREDFFKHLYDNFEKIGDKIKRSYNSPKELLKQYDSIIVCDTYTTGYVSNICIYKYFKEVDGIVQIGFFPGSRSDTIIIKSILWDWNIIEISDNRGINVLSLNDKFFSDLYTFIYGISYEENSLINTKTYNKILNLI